MKTKKWLFLRWALALLMMLNAFLPVSTAYADDEPTVPVDVTEYLTDFTAVITQDGEEIGEDDPIMSGKPISITISFGVPVLGDEPTPEHVVHKGDYAVYKLSDDFKLVASTSIPLEQLGTIVGHAIFEPDPDDPKMVTLKVLFDGEDEVYLEDSGLNSVTCRNLTANLEYDDDGEAGEAGDHEVTILTKSYTVTVPAVPIVYGLTKSGVRNAATGCIDWTVTVTATQGGEDVGLAGYWLADDLGDVGAYIETEENTFEVDGDSVTLDDEDGALTYEDGVLTYEFPAGTMSPAEITFSTKLSDEVLLATTEQRIKNKAELQDIGETVTVLASDEDEVRFTPKWIEKDGTTNDNPGGGIYDPTGRTITWTITVNHMEAALTNAVVTDTLPTGLTWVSATKETWNGTAWVNPVSVTPTGSDYALGDISAKTRLIIVTRVPDDAYTSGTKNYTNTATLSWEGLPATTPAPGASKTVGIGYNPIKKSGTADPFHQTIHWTVEVSPKSQTIDDLRVYDLLVYGSAQLDLSTVMGLPADVSPTSLAPQRRNQKFAEGSFFGDGFTCVVHPITRISDGVRVADLLEITGFVKDAVNTFVFDTVVLNPEYFAKNDTTSISNTVLLFSGTNKLNDATASVNYDSKMLVKRMLTRDAASDPAAGVNSGVTDTAALGFNYEDKSVVFRVGVNSNGMNLTGAKNASGETLGTATVTDTLPAGWEFVPFSEDVNYLIFEGIRTPDGSVMASDITPDTVTGLTPVISGGTATFTFTALTKPYVILLKAKLTDATAAAYFSENQSKTDTNTVSLKTEKWTTGVSSTQNVTINSTILTKDYDWPEAGVLRWTVDYRPYNLAQPGTKLEDTLSEGIELRRNASGALILDSGYITAHEMTLNADGTYTEGAPVTLVEGADGNIGYNPGKRALTFVFPDNTKAYHLTYLTDITGELGEEVSNEVDLIGGDTTQESVPKSYRVQGVDAVASLLRNGSITITKAGPNPAAPNENGPLAGAWFTLYAADGETVVKTGKTGVDGALKFKVIPDGTYILKETTAPEGYLVDRTVHTLTVTTSGSTVISSLDGQPGSGANAALAVRDFLEGTVGDLVITKIVAGNRGDPEKIFDFTVTFFADAQGEGQELEGEYAYFRGDAELPEGTIRSGDTVYLSHGEIITIVNLPKRTTYTVTEADYRSEGYRTASTGETGVIVEDTEQTAAFTNTKNRAKKDDKKPVERGTLTITKTVNGDLGDRDQLFTFVVSFDTDDSFRYSGSKIGSIEDGGTILLKHGESVVIRGIPAGTVYKVVEKEAGQGGYGTTSTGASGKITESGRTAAFVNEKEGVPNTGDESLDNTWTAGLAGSVLLLLGSVGLSLSFRKKKGKDNR